jgi:hypothetical protein
MTEISSYKVSKKTLSIAQSMIFLLQNIKKAFFITQNMIFSEKIFLGNFKRIIFGSVL